MPKVLNKHYAAPRVFFILGESLCIVCSVSLGMLLRFGGQFFLAVDVQSLGRMFLIGVVCQISLYYNNVYDFRVTKTHVELYLRLVQSLGISAIILAAIYYAFPSTMLGRGVFTISLGFLILLVSSWRYLYAWILKRKMFSQRIMLLGFGDLSKAIIDEIKDRKDSGYEVCGLVTMNSDFPRVVSQDIPHVSMNGNLGHLCKSLKAKQIVVGLEEKRGNLPVQELLQCKMRGIEILDAATFYEELTGKIYVEKLNPSWVIFSDGFQKPWTVRLSKRIVGFAMSSIGLLLLSPVIGLIALAIKLDSKGPIFYVQDRVGEDERVFKLYKFRSMIQNAEQGTGARWAADDDPRITWVGRLLRAYRLDEIPQMWNVLKGDLSFVGPRPERPEFVKKLKSNIPYYSERHSVKPGITGWAQVSFHYGASVEDAIEKLKYDLFYIKNMSFLLDLMIMWKTGKIVLLREGAR